MRYEGIRLDENGKLLRFLNFKAEYDSGNPIWQTIYKHNCIPYIDSGTENYFTRNYVFTTNKEIDDWKLVSTTYIIGGLRFIVKNGSARDTHGGFCFIYYNEDSEKYYTDAVTEIDSKSNIYIDGINYLNKEFYNAREDYPNENTFYNIVSNKSGFYDLMILTKATTLPYDNEYTENELASQISTLYDNNDYDFELAELSNYPLYPDSLVFHEDLNIDNEEWANRYKRYINSNDMNKASNFMYNAGISSYDSKILNLIEQRLYQITEIEASGSSHAMGNKPHLVDYGTITNPQTGMNYVSNNTSGGFDVVVQAGMGIASVSGSGSYEAGDTVTLSATPSSGYVFNEWEVSDPTVTIVNNQFIMPPRNVTVTATAIKGPGLYQTGTSTLLMSWEDLIDKPDPYSDPIIAVNGTTVESMYLDNSGLIGDLVLPTDINSIDPYDYCGCTQGLISIEMPNVTSISATTGYGAFDGCENLTSVVLPDEIEVIGDQTFNQCTSLTNIIGMSSVGTIGYNAFNSTAITSLNCTVESIGSSAFANCTALASVILGEGLTFIGDNAFANCESLSYIELPSSIETIDYGAFYGCDPNIEVTYGGTVDEWEQNFSDVFDSFSIIHCSDGDITHE